MFQVVLLMASAMGMGMTSAIVDLGNEPSARAVCVAEITEMIHVHICST
jgi:hypothetical protein